jgi:hypothetical protein
MTAILAEANQPKFVDAVDDATIRQKLLAEIKKEKRALASMINVVVLGGVVELWGAIVDERQREALKVAAENIPGVKEVKDHLAFVEPTSRIHRAEKRGCDPLAATDWGKAAWSKKEKLSWKAVHQFGTQ